MKILLIGQGGREHSLALKISQSPRLDKLYVAPGNPGTAQVATNIDIEASDIEKLADFALQNKIDITFVGPEAPLALGIVDIFEEKALKIIGPNKFASQLESSKSWAKSFYKKYNIPTANYESFSDYNKAISYIKNKNSYPVVIKADGLAGGKGVMIAYSQNEADKALKSYFIDKIFGKAGQIVVIEDFLIGEEASVLAFTDGQTILPMASAQDHKAIYNQDKGPNTGGMGAYSPAPIVTKEVEKNVYEKIFLPIIEGFKAEGIDYKGILYAGLMINKNEPYVVEFNIRFGDPETQVVLPRLKNDIIDIFEAILNRSLNKISLSWKKESAVCVVLASEGYPANYQKNKLVKIMDNFEYDTKTQLIHAGTKILDNKLLTNGGRVFGIVGLGNSLPLAINKAYEAVEWVNFEGKYFRSDIGKKGL